MKTIDQYSKGQLAQLARRKNLTKVNESRKVYKRVKFKLEY
jgi:hypothetical protein